MQIWVGLGNPGTRYALNRHNVGFMACDIFGEMYKFGSTQTKFQASVRSGEIASQTILLLKPNTFMNESGRSVGQALNFYKLGPEAVTIFYDDLDLDPFKIRVKSGGGAAGHNGIRSLIAHIGPEFRRVRIGIGHPGDKNLVSSYVLGNFSKSEKKQLEKMLSAIASEAEWLAQSDPARFVNDYNLRMT